MSTPDLSEELRQFGPPVFVTDDLAWRVAAVEHTGGRPDAVVVLSRNGALVLRTECLSRPPEPRWVDIKNVQAASMHRPDTTNEQSEAVEVADKEAEVFVDDRAVHVRVLCSHPSPGIALTAETFRLTVEIDGRRLTVAGDAPELKGLRLRTLSDWESCRPGDPLL